MLAMAAVLRTVAFGTTAGLNGRTPHAMASSAGARMTMSATTAAAAAPSSSAPSSVLIVGSTLDAASATIHAELVRREGWGEPIALGSGSSYRHRDADVSLFMLDAIRSV